MDILVEQHERSTITADKVKALCENIISAEVCGKDFELHVEFIDEAAMTDLNSRYRNVEKTTDVISFPVFNSKKDIEDDPAEYILLGNVFICESYIFKANYSDKDRTLSHIKLAVAHGTLHCLGYTHDTDEEEKAMNRVQEKYLPESEEGAQ